MKAIMTKFHGPTNTKGSRISASDGDGNRVIISKSFDWNQEDGHKQAIFALCDKMGWSKPDAYGWFKNGLIGVWKED
jgi:hypothetical protein